uniref:Uncharacterized protein n=1 Tax=Oryza punctata TaxID=4537 RepID=A0A0E0KZ32_ORYPU
MRTPPPPPPLTSSAGAASLPPSPRSAAPGTPRSLLSPSPLVWRKKCTQRRTLRSAATSFSVRPPRVSPKSSKDLEGPAIFFYYLIQIQI